MKRDNKRMKQAHAGVDPSKRYSLTDAVSILKQAPHPKFVESVDLSIKLGLDVKETSLAVRGTVRLPHGTGKVVRVAVFCKGEAVNAVQEAGASFFGGAELVEKVSQGFLDFDVAIATPDMMKDVGRLGKVLGPRGLMPNPKSGTVTEDVVRAVKEVKAGKIEFKMDKQANIHCAIGKLSFEPPALVENAKVLLHAIATAKPAAAKGEYIRRVTLSSTMGPGVTIASSEIEA